MQRQEEEITQAIGHVARSMGRTLQAVFRDGELTRGEMAILMHLLVGHDSPSAIAHMQGVSRSMVSRSVDTLTRKGYICIRRDDRDRRLIRLELGEQGRQVAAEVDAAGREYLGWLYASITQEEKDELERIMKKMAARVRQPYERKGGGDR